MRRLSVIIPNYNYVRFVGDSVRSALSLDWPDVEVIVVDDGSTDDSLEILRSFGSRITLIEQENAGPRAACNRGFAASTGDMVMFLDSDDMVDASLVREIEGAMQPGVSKVQVQMRRIDRDGQVRGRPFPAYRYTPTPEQIRHWMTATSAYPTPPGSGNVYSREFLEQLFPLDGRCGDATDSACLAAAPFLGDVVTVPKPLVSYRVHGGNRSSIVADPLRLTKQIERAWQRDRFSREVRGLRSEAVGALLRGRHLLQMRVAERRVCTGSAPLPTDGRWRMLRDSFTTMFAPGPEPMHHRLLIASWCVTTLLAPAPFARRLVRWRFM